jgi:ABC-type lipoprotein export system ATPase subunit
MLTRLRVRNFKRFDDVDIELGKAVVLIGPNNSGKTTALQALALWDIGVRRWNEKRKGKVSPEKRPGVTINRRDLISVPVPDANLLWRDLHVRNVEQVLDASKKTKKPKTENIRIDVAVDGISNGRKWSCGLEFDYANAESFYCRPLRTGDGEKPPRLQVPPEAAKVRVAFLPPMSGLMADEPKWEPGRINVLIGEGQTAQVLRNLCFQIHSQPGPDSLWHRLVEDIEQLFGVELMPPTYVAERGEITMAYKERGGTKLDLSSSGRGLQQTLLLLAYLYSNPHSVLLIDEPDAHLEILRQREIYRLITEVSENQGSQIIAASHSEVVMNEAAGSGVVIAFVGEPHRMNDRGSQIIKALTDIGWDQYYQAEQTGWVLYIENSTDLAILQTLARRLEHPAAALLERPFVHYVTTNLPQRARDHFFGLREAKADLVGIAIFDRLEKELHKDSPLVELMWTRREIENYICSRQVLLAYARHDFPDDLFGLVEQKNRVSLMERAIDQVADALRTLNKPNPWSADIKASEEFLDPVFKEFFKGLNLPLTFRKSDYHLLAELAPKDQIDREIHEKLDAIVAVAQRANPRKT